MTRQSQCSSFFLFVRCLPGEKINQIEELLPGNWKPPTMESG